ncbi:MAG: hypothetical protein WAW61_11790 [Methylococcaceae bacterium]
MSKNKVQFLKGMCLTDFMTLYGSEKPCRDVVYQTKPIGRMVFAARNAVITTAVKFSAASVFSVAVVTT